MFQLRNLLLLLVSCITFYFLIAIPERMVDWIAGLKLESDIEDFHYNSSFFFTISSEREREEDHNLLSNLKVGPCAIRS